MYFSEFSGSKQVSYLKRLNRRPQLPPLLLFITKPSPTVTDPAHREGDDSKEGRLHGFMRALSLLGAGLMGERQASSSFRSNLPPSIMKGRLKSYGNQSQCHLAHLKPIINTKLTNRGGKIYKSTFQMSLGVQFKNHHHHHKLFAIQPGHQQLTWRGGHLGWGWEAPRVNVCRKSVNEMRCLPRPK